MAARTTIVQADHLGPLEPDDIHLPGPFVDHLVATALEPVS
jgi:3-oxoacid CoA-transferase subunit A